MSGTLPLLRSSVGNDVTSLNCLPNVCYAQNWKMLTLALRLFRMWEPFWLSVFVAQLKPEKIKVGFNEQPTNMR